MEGLVLQVRSISAQEGRSVSYQAHLECCKGIMTTAIAWAGTSHILTKDMYFASVLSTQKCHPQNCILTAIVQRRGCNSQSLPLLCLIVFLLTSDDYVVSAGHFPVKSCHMLTPVLFSILSLG